MRPLNNEVFYANTDLVITSRKDISHLKELASANPRRRVRLCTHRDIDDRIHEMLIVLGKGNYVRPHRHTNKPESFHVIEGVADVILFGEDGKAYQIVKMGEYHSGRQFFLRIDKPVYHSVVVASGFFVFHEATSGPFNRDDTEFAPWAPEESQAVAGNAFMKNALCNLES